MAIKSYRMYGQFVELELLVFFIVLPLFIESQNVNLCDRSSYALGELILAIHYLCMWLYAQNDLWRM